MKRKSSHRGEAAKNLVTPAAAGIGIAAAADRIGPLVHYAADRVGPLAQSAADRVGPLAQSAADRVGPLAQTAADKIAPLANQTVSRVSPYATRAAGYVSPIAVLAAGRVTPLAQNARVRSVLVAHGAAEAIRPRLDEAWIRVYPVVDATSHRINDDLIPRVSGVVAAAATSPIVVEASKRSRATWAAARGELELPVPKPRRGRGWVLRVAVVTALGGAAAFAAKSLLGSKDADWQSARPTTTFPPAKPANSAAPTITEPTGGSTGPLDWAVATGQADPPPDLLDEASEQRIVEHVGEPSDLPTEAAPEATVAEKPAEPDLPMSEAPRTSDASESNMPGKDGTRTTGESGSHS